MCREYFLIVVYVIFFFVLHDIFLFIVFLVPLVIPFTFLIGWIITPLVPPVGFLSNICIMSEGRRTVYGSIQLGIFDSMKKVVVEICLCRLKFILRKRCKAVVIVARCISARGGCT